MDKSRNNSDRILTLNGKCYKLQRYIDATEQDIHHLIGKKYRMKYNTNADENKVKIQRRKHIALNSFFWDKQSPREQLIEVFNLVKPVLSPWVRRELHTILELTTDDMFYIPEVIKNKKNGKQREKNWELSMQELNTDDKEKL